MIEKKLGKLEGVKFGLGGYQDACIGLSVTISGAGWGVADNKSVWDFNLVECTKYCNWTEEDRADQCKSIMKFISDLLNDAKVNSIDKLNGIPVEAEFDGMNLKSWRVLTEVL